MKGRKRTMIKGLIIIGIILCILVVAVLIILPPGGGKPTRYLDQNGNVMDGSVCEKTFLNYDNGKLGMTLLGKDTSKPLILFCSSGPGIPEYLLESFYPTNLSDDYVVCYTEMRGVGLSYDASIPTKDITTEQYIKDITAITDYLKDRFHQDKIYIIGHSFGTYIALKTVQLHPENYYAYIAMSQISNQAESEKQAYYYMKNQYEQTGNKKMVKKFDKYPIEQSNEELQKYISSPLRDQAMHDLGVGTTRNMKSVISGIFLPSLRCKDYTQAERINIWKGKVRSFDFAVVHDSFQFNAFDDVPSIEIPIYFFAGRYDYTCSYSIQKQYYEYMKAPDKKFYTFENSAHSPLFEEPDKALSILKNEIIH